MSSLYNMMPQDDDTPMHRVAKYMAAHDYAKKQFPDEKLGRMGGDTSPKKKIEIASEGFKAGCDWMREMIVEHIKSGRDSIEFITNYYSNK